MNVSILEVIGRTHQGVTQPFICKGDDGEIYFVKGIGAGRRGQICEWVAGQLAQRVGLPIPRFEIVDVPRELINLRTRSDLAELGPGPAFGSARCQVTELTASQIGAIPAATQQEILAFDWWVRNPDRTLSELGGNPNLFWDSASQRLLVLDHNLAFDDSFDPQAFLESHAFRNRRHHLAQDVPTQQLLRDRFEAALKAWDEICNTVPEEWWLLHPEGGVETPFDTSGTLDLLARIHRDDFWVFP